MENDVSDEKNKITTLLELRNRMNKFFNLDENHFSLKTVSKIIKKCGFRRKRVKKIKN